MTHPLNTPKKLRWCATAWLGMAAIALVLTAVPVASLAQVSATALATQSSSERGVTVKVTPQAMGSPEGRWTFAVVLDTHSADINDDLVQSASLITNDGRTIKPGSWTGAPPGGHHREGVLAFDVPAPQPRTIELRIERPGESSARSFRWEF